MESSNFDLEETIAVAKRAQPKGCEFSGPNRALTAYFACPDLVLECSEEIVRLRQENKELKEWKSKAEKLSKSIVEPALTLAVHDYPLSVGPEGNKKEWERFIKGQPSAD
ncbi:hypothetical protein P3566_22035 [Vibrio parahaemolyticus]|nr:hypothetical protein [Vibrio parahaemolyticus]HBB9946509.1 hypothetical protein [Vibrio parahaemolyticus]